MSIDMRSVAWRGFRRRLRFTRLLAAYQVEPGDWALIREVPDGPQVTLSQLLTPGSEEDLSLLERYVLLSERRDVGRLLQRSASREDMEVLACLNLPFEVSPVCFFDLDELEGTEPPPGDRDRVRVPSDPPTERAVHYFIRADLGNGTYELAAKEGGEAVRSAAIDDIEIVFRADPASDPRLPQRFDVAAVKTIVAFNSVPTPPAVSARGPS